MVIKRDIVRLYIQRTMNRIFIAVLFLTVSTQSVFVFGLNFHWLYGSNKLQPSDVQDAQINFAINLLQEVAKSGKSTLVSPFSIFTLLSVAYFTAHGKTKLQMGQILTGHPKTKKAEVEKYFTDFLESVTRTNCNNYTMKAANRLYIHDDTLSDDFVLPLLYLYNGEIVHKCESFQNDAILQDIANWTLNATENKIGGVEMKIRKNEMLMLNIINFKDEWQIRFDRQLKKRFFHHSEKEKEAKLMMATDGTFLNYMDDLLNVLILPYASTEVQMVLILPKIRFTLASVLEKLTKEKLIECMKNAAPTKLKLVLPKFRLETKYNLEEFFKKNGVTKAFSEKAEFLMKKRQIYLTKILQGGLIQLDEVGTDISEISTFVYRSDRSNNSEVSKLNASSYGKLKRFQPLNMFVGDQPFLYFIIKNHQTILFAGQYS
uniref:Serpin domain-containing protein n=1 Tax=Setaria digitata TaxID=48799 RepID=A0A915PNR9_9BILA